MPVRYLSCWYDWHSASGRRLRGAFATADYTAVEELMAADEKDLVALDDLGPKAIRIS